MNIEPKKKTSSDLRQEAEENLKESAIMAFEEFIESEPEIEELDRFLRFMDGDYVE